jgi:hypothetical protein
MCLFISSYSNLNEAAMISDALLIFLPLRALRELKNQQRLRQRLQLIFTASALTTSASIVSGAFNLYHVGFGLTVVVQIEVYHLRFHLLSPPSRVFSFLQSGHDIHRFLSSNAGRGVALGLQFCHPR